MIDRPRAGWLSFAAFLLAGACAADEKPPADGPAKDGGSETDSSIDAGAPPTEGDQFLLEYADAVCSMYEPCCESEALGFDRSGCREWYRKVFAAYAPGEFRVDAAASCLTRLADARDADAQRCATELDFDEATLRSDCRQAFRVQREGAALGERCMLAGDCASVEGPGTVLCYGRSCMLEKRGAEADGPCYLGGNSGIEGVPNEAYRCEAKDGLFCHRGDNACRRHVEDGEYCPYPNACQPGSMCIGGSCVGLPGPGEPCANAIPGAGGFCEPGSTCDRTTLVCGGAALAEGETCREDTQCASRSCMNGSCAKPQFTRALNCTGRD